MEDGEPEELGSKLNGVPWLRPDEPTPTCRECGRALQLFVQLVLEDLPPEIAAATGPGTLQLFYCVGQRFGAPPDGRPECYADGGWEAFDTGASLVRVVPPDVELHPRLDVPADGFPAKRVVEWEPFDDVPDVEDQGATGLHRDYDEAARSVRFRCEAVGLDAKITYEEIGDEDIALAAHGDKLGGWPFWVQGNDLPACPTCGTTMQHVFQVDSEHNVPFMFGDVGTGHITQCPVHHEVVAFAWACC